MITDKRITEDFVAIADKLITTSSINGARYQLCMAFVPVARRAGFDFMTETKSICEAAFKAGIGALDVFLGYCA